MMPDHVVLATGSGIIVLMWEKKELGGESAMEFACCKARTKVRVTLQHCRR
jgi:hypothetical protein